MVGCTRDYGERVWEKTCETYSHKSRERVRKSESNRKERGVREVDGEARSGGWQRWIRFISRWEALAFPASDDLLGYNVVTHDLSLPTRRHRYHAIPARTFRFLSLLLCPPLSSQAHGLNCLYSYILIIVIQESDGEFRSFFGSGGVLAPGNLPW